MKTLSARRRIVVLCSVTLWGALGYACSVEDENPGSTRSRGADGSAEGAVDPNAVTDGALGPALCGKYGGYENVKQIAAAILTEVSQDCRISAPIAGLDANDTRHLSECFEILVGGAFQCPGVSYVGGTTKDSQGQRCRSMAQAHQGLNLRNADFQAFTESIASALGKNGVSDEDIRSLAPAFEGYRTGVVQTLNQSTKNTHCTCPDGLYMGKGCLPEGGGGNDGGNDGDAGNDGSMDAGQDG